MTDNTATARHFDGMHIEGTMNIEIDYQAEPVHAARALHERANQLEQRVKTGKAADPEQLDSEIVNLRLMADKIVEADPT